MINLMGSCFEEAYTKFLAKEEYEFKLRLEAEMRKETVQKFSELHQIHDEAQCRRVRPRILSVVTEEGDYVHSKNKLIKCVAELNVSLVQTLQSSSKDIVCSRLKIKMAETKDLLDAELKHLSKKNSLRNSIDG